ncbi:MAG: hypothetical protein WBC92_07045 [Terracidiphilus sp.]
MEIGPIPGIRALPAVRGRQTVFRPPAVFDIDGSAKPGEGGGQRNGRKAAGAEESDEDDFTFDGEMEPGGEAQGEIRAQRVDYFA